MRAMVAQRARGRVTLSGATKNEWNTPALHLLFVWALTLLDLQFFLSNVVARPLVYIVYLGYPPLLLMMALKGPAIIATTKGWVWYPPLVLLLIVAAITLPVAENKAIAKMSLQYLVIYYGLALGTALYIRTVRQSLPIVLMLFGQFAWFGLFAGTKGLVPWHPTLANYDGFGGLMVQGAGLCYWFAVAARSRKTKAFLYVLAAYCVLGVVASFARAAFLSLVALVGWVWIRSPRKLLTGAGIVAAGLVVIAAASLIFEPGFFYNEIMSAFEEGTEQGTGAQRWEVWKVGFKVWMQHPILGVGGGNVGAYAATHFRYGELAAFPNPSVLYGHNLHNVYMQVLSEFGLVGIGAFAWALWDFQKRNREIREAGAVARWAQQNARWNVGYLALGLEAANIANILNGMFYASLFMPWFFTVWIGNRMLWSVTRPPPQERPGRRGRGLPAPAPIPGGPSG
jgi:O-antigen ligase